MPPKQKSAANTPETGTRTRAATTAMPSPLSHDDADLATAQESDIRCEKDAREWMVKGVYLVQGESVTPKRLAHAMLQMAASIPKLAKMGMNALRVAAYILEGLDMEQEEKAIREAVGANMQKVLKAKFLQTLHEVKETTSDIAKEGERLAEAVETLSKMAANAETTDRLVPDAAHLENVVGDVLARTEQVVKILQEEKEQRETRGTYAAAVSDGIMSMPKKRLTRALVFHRPHLVPSLLQLLEMWIHHRFHHIHCFHVIKPTPGCSRDRYSDLSGVCDFFFFPASLGIAVHHGKMPGGTLSEDGLNRRGACGRSSRGMLSFYYLAVSRLLLHHRNAPKVSHPFCPKNPLKSTYHYRESISFLVVNNQRTF